jgi:formamidopyrimidine-DNA glycosylase
MGAGMPEGHTLHRLARDHAPLVGCTVAASSPQGRFGTGAAAIDGCRLDGVDAFGKHLLHHYGSHHLHVHLGKAGVFVPVRRREEPARPQVRLRLDFDVAAQTWDLIAPLRCELLTGEEVAALVGSLGPDPLCPGADAGEARRRLADYPGATGVALLDQAVLAGVGNVFRAEALAAPAGPDLAEEDARYVYKQKLCGRCGDEISSWDLHGRTAYACPTCQPS